MIPGDAGGYMGLLIGASCLTLCEVLDLIFYNCTLKLAGKRKTAPIVASQNGVVATQDKKKCLENDIYSDRHVTPMPEVVYWWRYFVFKWLLSKTIRNRRRTCTFSTNKCSVGVIAKSFARKHGKWDFLTSYTLFIKWYRDPMDIGYLGEHYLFSRFFPCVIYVLKI